MKGWCFKLPILFSLAWSALCGGAPEIRLIDHIAVSGTDIHLGDIATVTADTEEQARKLRNVVISDLPSVGRTRVLSAFRIKHALQKQGWEDVSILGLQSTVAVQSRIVEEAELRNVIHNWVAESTAKQQEFDIDYIELPRNWEIPAGEEVEITVESKAQAPKGALTLTLRAKGNGRVLANSRARIEVSLYQDALVLIRPLRRGDKLSSDDVELRRADVTKSNGMEATDPDSLIGMTAKANLKLGTVLSVTHFDQPVVITRGSVNRILVLNGQVRLSVAGAEALQDGKKGEEILFRNPMNPKDPLRARVLRPGLAVVRMR
ncbi:MAG: flagellar basal body P-ring formation protein FlgA [Chlamydiia bacterium]|nr:flagellar basal body P-ring formation protein FlgA [Chlamydiia bacterium]